MLSFLHVPCITVALGGQVEVIKGKKGDDELLLYNTSARPRANYVSRSLLWHFSRQVFFLAQARIRCPYHFLHIGYNLKTYTLFWEVKYEAGKLVQMMRIYL